MTTFFQKIDQFEFIVDSGDMESFELLPEDDDDADGRLARPKHSAAFKA
jgi:hypothetical protein